MWSHQTDAIRVASVIANRKDKTMGNYALLADEVVLYEGVVTSNIIKEPYN